MDEKVSILIVDDNVSQCKTMSAILNHNGYAVMTAHDGLEAVAQVRERAFDIVFLDISMPIMNGVETQRRIRRIRPETVVVMMTAYAVEELVQEALQEGAYGIFYKPLDMEEAIALIERATAVKQDALVLIVDDDLGTCTTFKSILAKKGYQVEIAATGETAVSQVHNTTHDIIFIDMKLPLMNGLETYLEIKKINPHAIVIMMTGYRQEMEALVKEALHHNAHACLYKPLDMDTVLTLVENIWSQKQHSVKD